MIIRLVSIIVLALIILTLIAVLVPAQHYHITRLEKHYTAYGNCIWVDGVAAICVNKGWGRPLLIIRIDTMVNNG